jgi:hypothetical protein
MQNNYKIPFVNKAELAISEQDTILVVDEDTGSKFTSFIFKGTYNGAFKYFVIDRYNSIYPVSLLSSTWAQIYSTHVASLGQLNKAGQVESWDMDRGDLQIEGLVSSGRYVA